MKEAAVDETEPTEDAPDAELQAQLTEAQQGLEREMRLLPPGMVIGLPQPAQLELTAQGNAICELLKAKGLVTEAELVDQKNRCYIALVESLREQVTKAKREASGLVIAGPGQHV